jgi:hypothetical protein
MRAILRTAAGATLRELMDRMGHGSTRAAFVYLHATSQRQRTIADAVGTMTRAALRETVTFLVRRLFASPVMSDR